MQVYHYFHFLDSLDSDLDMKALFYWNAKRLVFSNGRRIMSDLLLFRDDHLLGLFNIYSCFIVSNSISVQN